MKVVKENPPSMKNKNPIKNSGRPSDIKPRRRARGMRNAVAPMPIQGDAALFLNEAGIGEYPAAPILKKKGVFLKNRGACLAKCRLNRPIGWLALNALVFILFFGIGFYAARACHNPMVSVVMPTYNRADFLPRAIESVLNQTYRDFEFIIIDDGSEDNSWELLKTYAQKDHRIRLLKNKKNRGISYARNRGNAAARGKYIMIMDSDDISMPQRMEKHVAFMQVHPDVVLSTSLRKSLQGDMEDQPPMSRYEPSLLFHITIGHGEWVLRRAFLNKFSIRYDETQIVAEDYDYLRQILINHGKIGYLDEILYLRRHHKTNSNEYYRLQKVNEQMNSFRFLLNYGVPEDMILRNDMCEIYEYVAEANKTKKYLNQESLDRVVEVCRKQNM